MPIPMTNAKPYTIAMIGDNDAEISMYGEVVEQRPVDWWTGEPIPGNFIALDDFLRDLDELGAKDNITVHINSVGGSLYAGLAIYNRLRALSANVTTINDALAASAASIIFQAGNTRKVNAGSNLMIHEAAAFMFGFYQIKDLKDSIKYLEAHNKTAVAAYAERTGKDADSIKTMLSRETWMTGQEAVDAGFADEVISNGGDVTMSLTPDKRFIVSNGVAMSTRGMSTMPAAAAVMSKEQAAAFMPAAVSASVSPAPQVDIDKNTGGNIMAEIKSMEDLRAAFPDLVGQVENAAKASERAEGINSERARIQGIEAIEAAIGDKEMVKNAKYGENPLTAEQLALKAMQAQAALGANMLTSMEGDTKDSGVEGVEANAAPAGEVAPDSPEAMMAQAKADVAAFNKMKEVR